TETTVAREVPASAIYGLTGKREIRSQRLFIAASIRAKTLLEQRLSPGVIPCFEIDVHEHDRSDVAERRVLGCSSNRLELSRRRLQLVRRQQRLGTLDPALIHLRRLRC